jgi:phenylpyruvate tautomerase PptA (4-oxalocrotonate tautomerase family)
MPIAYIDVPQGIRIEAKKKLVKEVCDAIHEAYPIPILGSCCANGHSRT